MSQAWQTEGQQMTNTLVSATINTSSNWEKTQVDIAVNDKEGLFYKKENAPTIIGIGTKTPFSRLSFGDYATNNLLNGQDKNESLVNNPVIAFSETNTGTNATGIAFYRAPAISGSSSGGEQRGLRFVVNNNASSTSVEDTGLIPGTNSNNVKDDNTIMLLANDGTNNKVFINSVTSKFANASGGLEVNGDMRVTGGIIFHPTTSKQAKNQQGLIYYDSNEKCLKYSTGTGQNDDIYNIMAQNSAGHILGVDGEFAINVQQYDLSFGLVVNTDSQSAMFAFKDLGFIIGNGDMFKTNATNFEWDVNGNTGLPWVNKTYVPALAVLGHNQGSMSANGNVMVCNINDVEPIPILSKTSETNDVSANGVIYLQNNVAIGIKQPEAIIDVSKINVPFLNMGRNITNYYNSVVIGDDISGSSNSFYFGNEISNSANFDNSYNFVFGNGLDINTSVNNFENNLIFGSNHIVQNNNNFVFGDSLQIKNADISYCILLGKGVGEANVGDLIKYFEDGEAVFKVRSGGDTTIAGNMVIGKDVSANDASFNNIIVQKIGDESNKIQLIHIKNIAAEDVTIQNKLAVGKTSLHNDYSLDVSGGLIVSKGKFEGNIIDLSDNNAVKVTISAPDTSITLHETSTNVYGKTILKHQNGSTILKADGSGTGASNIKLYTHQTDNTEHLIKMDGSGNLGIGTGAPHSKFHLKDDIGYLGDHSHEGIQIGKDKTDKDYKIIMSTVDSSKCSIEFGDITNSASKGSIIFDNNTDNLSLKAANNTEIYSNNSKIVTVNSTGLTVGGELDAGSLKIAGKLFDTAAASAFASNNSTNYSGNTAGLYVPMKIAINTSTPETGTLSFKPNFDLDVSGNIRSDNMFFGKLYINMVPKALSDYQNTVENKIYGSGSYDVSESFIASSTYPAWHLFDNSDTTYWNSLGTNSGTVKGLSGNNVEIDIPGKYFEIVLPQRYCLKKYGFKSTANIVKMPNKWMVIGKIGKNNEVHSSDVNNKWKIVDEKDVGATNYATNTSMNYFTVNNYGYSGESYKILRFYFEETFEGVTDTNDVEMCGIELYGETTHLIDPSSSIIQSEVRDVSGLKHLAMQPFGGHVSIGKVAPSDKVQLDISGTGAIRVPVGTESQRPSNADANGCLRFNTDADQFEGCSDGSWKGLGGTISKNRLTKITADDDNSKGLQFDVSGVEYMRMDGSGNIDISGVLKVKGFIAQHGDIIKETMNGCKTKHLYGIYDVAYDVAGDGLFYATAPDGSTSVVNTPAAFPGTVLQFNLNHSGNNVFVSDANNLDIGGLIHISNDNVVTTGNGSGHDTGTLLWFVPYDALGTYKFSSSLTNNTSAFEIIIDPIPSDISANELSGNRIYANNLYVKSLLETEDLSANEISGNQIYTNKLNVINFLETEDLSANEISGNQIYANKLNVLDELDAIDISANDISGVFIFANKLISDSIGLGTHAPANKVELDINGTGSIRLPIGNDSQRPANGDALGCLRYNNSDNQFEGYGDGGWAGLGGVIDKDMDTKILAESTTDEDKLRFFTAGPERMIIDTIGNIGIGTSDPSENVILDISSSGAIRIPIGDDSERPANNVSMGCLRYNNQANQFEGYGDGGWAGLGGVIDKDMDTKIEAEKNADEDKLRFTTAGTEKMIIDDVGNVGIGNSDPSENVILDISSSGAIRIPIGDDSERPLDSVSMGCLRYNNSDNQFEGYGDGGWAGLGGVISKDTNTKITAHNDTADGLKFIGEGIEHMRMLGNGNLGIGTTTPSVKLEVNGDISANKIVLYDALETEDLSANDISGEHIFANMFDANNVKVATFLEAEDLSANEISGNEIHAQTMKIYGDLSGNNARLHDVSVNRLWIGDIEMIGQVSGSVANPTSVGTLAGNFVVDGDISANDASFNVVDTKQLSISNSLNVHNESDNCEVKITHGNEANYAKLSIMGGGNPSFDGTGELYIGQDSSWGGGIIYNGDGTPSHGGSSTDNISFYRRSNGTNYEVFKYAHNNNTVFFNDRIVIKKSTPPWDEPPNYPVGSYVNGMYLQLGEYESKANGYRLIGFGYATNNWVGNYSTVDAWMGTITVDSGSGEYSDIIFGTANDTGVQTDPTEKMRITWNGRVGIGTKTPGYILDVSGTGAMRIPVGDGTARAALTGTNGLIRYNTTDNQFEGYGNGAWGSLGGVSTPEGYTRIDSDNTNGLEFYTGTASANERMVIDSAGKVGIGKTSPGEKLDVNGTVKATALMYGTTDVATELSSKQATITGATSEITSSNLTASRALVSSSTGKVAASAVTSTELGYLDGVSSSIQAQINNKVSSQWVTSGSKIYYNSGNVGIGITSASTPLHIYTDDVADGCFITLEADGTGGSGGNSFSGITFKTNDGNPANPTSSEPTYISGKIISGWPLDPFGSGYTWGKKAFIKFQTPSGNSQTGALVDAMTIQGGNVGIGTTSPESALHVVGELESTPTSKGIHMGSVNNASIEIVAASSSNDSHIDFGYPNENFKGRIIYKCGTDDMKFCTNGSYKMTIDTDGKVGIGTESPGLPLDVATSISPPHADVIGYWNRAGTNADGFFIASDGVTFGSDVQGALGVGDSGEAGDLDAQAANSRYFNQKPISAHFYDYILLSNGGILMSSDERIKKNIIEFEDPVALRMLRDISCVSYYYIDKIKQEEPTIGFIAQQVKTILPQAINFERRFIPDQMKRLNTSWNGLNMSWIGTDASYNLLDESGNIVDVSGIKYQFFVKNDLSDNEVRVSAMGNEDGTFTFDNSYNYVFCYGKEVDDFHSLDKFKLFTVNFSATQEIDKIQQEEKAKLSAAETKLAAAETKLAAAETKLAAAETKITSLETQLAAVLARLDALENP